ncbi:MAG: TonB family protein [Bacteroidota bacterium]|nr:TonB family protein [Bacteroidota bacterium]
MKNIIAVALVFISLIGKAQTNSYTDSLIKVRTAELNKLKPLFQQKKDKDDSAFAVVYSDLHSVASAVSLLSDFSIPGAQKNYSAPGYPGSSQKEFEKAKPGEVIGPFVSGNVIGIYKVKSKGLSADSAMVRHLLITYRGADRADPQISRPRWKAKELADSLCKIIVSGKTAMTDLILPFTNDPGSRLGNLGNYGMFSKESGFVKEFEDAGFNNPVGATMVVETPFGYHIIQVLEKKTSQFTVKVIPLERVVDPELDYRQQQQNGVTLPDFPGGITALRIYLSNNLHYPEKEQARHAEASIAIMFKVGKDGKIYDVAEVKNEAAANPEFVAEAKRLIAAMPQWKPATYKQKEIDWILRVKVPFRLDENYAVSYQIPPPPSRPVTNDPASSPGRQQTVYEDSIYVASDTIWKHNEVLPLYPGGKEAFQEFLKSTIKYPIEEKAAGKQGTIRVSFTVEKDGSVTQIYAQNEIAGAPGLTIEAIRVISLMQPWTPGTINGRPVRVQMTQAITFALVMKPQ